MLSSSEPPGCYFARKLYLSGVYFLGKLTACLEANVDGDVEVGPLDQLIHEKIDFIKIDVEKMELEMLEGAQQVIATYRPDIFVEVMNKNVPGFEIILKKIGYHILTKFPYANAVNYYIAPDSQTVA